MLATDHQKKEIVRMAKQFWGDEWEETLDVFCITHLDTDGNESKPFDYQGIDALDNLQAAWLMDELEVRCQSLKYTSGRLV